MSAKKMDVQSTVNDSTKNDQIDEISLKKGAVEFQRFWLRPLTGAGKKIPLRLRINKRFGGWRLKDELVNALGSHYFKTVIVIYCCPRRVWRSNHIKLGIINII